MIKVYLTTILFCCLGYISVYAQDVATEPEKDKKKITTSIGLGGRALVFTDFNGNWYYNMGGPNIAADYGKWKISLHMMPSLRYNDSLKAKVIPTLGAGPQLAYKWVTVGCGFYYLGEKEKWTTNVGLGIRLAKSG